MYVNNRIACKNRVQENHAPDANVFATLIVAPCLFSSCHHLVVPFALPQEATADNEKSVLYLLLKMFVGSRSGQLKTSTRMLVVKVRHPLDCIRDPLLAHVKLG